MDKILVSSLVALGLFVGVLVLLEVGRRLGVHGDLLKWLKETLAERVRGSAPPPDSWTHRSAWCSPSTT